MGDGGGDIIIKGGSVEIFFDYLTFQKDLLDPKKHRNAGAKITRVTISGDTQFQDVDTGTHPDRFTGTIRVYCDND